jgi:hypothetical protein
MAITNVVVLVRNDGKRAVVAVKKADLPSNIGNQLYGGEKPDGVKSWKNGQIYDDVNGVPHIPVHYFPNSARYVQYCNLSILVGGKINYL